MKYLFAAIDARQARLKESHKGTSVGVRPTRPKYNSLELKRLVIEASEAVDDKSAATDFQDTLERIVNEIKNTTEHSGPFLQKVRKSDVPDYYDVIKRPMDLATLLKKVRQQSFRTKKAFAEDLDLIWSNCLLYNSHPDHPLRANAQALREKSHQLLEFITDPVMNQRNLLAASLGPLDRRNGSFLACTPDNEDGDADAESDDDRSRRGVSERIFHGLNGDGRDGTDSPAQSRSQTPGMVEKQLHRKASRGPLARISASPAPPALVQLPFEERPALVRTAHTMNDFLVLEAELSRLERSDFKPVPTSSVLPASDLSTAPSTSSTSASEDKNRVAALIRSLNPTILPALPRPILQSGSSTHADPSTPSSQTSQPASPLKTASGALRDPTEPVESLWWDLVASASHSSQLFPHAESSTRPSVNGKPDGHDNDPPRSSVHKTEELPIAALAAGVPRIPWIGYRATPYMPTSTGTSNTKGKGKAVVNGSEAEPVRKRVKRSKPVHKGETGLAVKMKSNCDLLRRIRVEGDRLLRENQAGDFKDLPAVLIDESDEDVPEGGLLGDSSEPIRPRPRKRARFAAASVRKSAFRCPATAPVAARDALKAATAGVLDHAGFEGSSAMALDVLTHAAAEYISNLGRTMRFFADRYGAAKSKEEILAHALSESGIPSPSTLRDYVTDDIDHYSTRLTDLLDKLERSRQARLHALTPEDEKAVDEADQIIDADGGEALVRGEVSNWTGDDFFGLGEVGLDRELGSATLVVPKRVFRGDMTLSPESSTSLVLYPPPPPFVPLTSDAISLQIGLLQPILTQRQDTEFGLIDDALQTNRPKTTRHKVPLSGKIPYKSSRPRPTDPTLPASMQVVHEPPKRKKKKDKSAKFAANATTSTPAPALPLLGDDQMMV
ncbi:SAGA histone acetyltransferase complex subunit SPT7 [Sporobolomyces koalae]|uniref:SAGA histone acetyltransferase complex subunit SPT7 n=1 Tax=Sporobolomyces koalae TaxID=500713 RepID=UPI00317722CF